MMEYKQMIETIISPILTGDDNLIDNGFLWPEIETPATRPEKPNSIKEKTITVFKKGEIKDEYLLRRDEKR